MFIIAKSKHSECTNCRKKPDIEVKMGMVAIDLCEQCAKGLGLMLVDNYCDEEEDGDEYGLV